MKVRTALLALARVIADECEQNAPFRKRIEEALTHRSANKKTEKISVRQAAARPHRRPPAVLDPIDLTKLGEGVLRERLRALDLEQLKDVVAEYGMDPSKLVMKWKDKDRIVSHIVETSTMRASKGDAFRQ